MEIFSQLDFLCCFPRRVVETLTIAGLFTHRLTVTVTFTHSQNQYLWTFLDTWITRPRRLLFFLYTHRAENNLVKIFNRRCWTLGTHTGLKREERKKKNIINTNRTTNFAYYGMESTQRSIAKFRYFQSDSKVLQLESSQDVLWNFMIQLIELNALVSLAITTHVVTVETASPTLKSRGLKPK